MYVIPSSSSFLPILCITLYSRCGPYVVARKLYKNAA